MALISFEDVKFRYPKGAKEFKFNFQFSSGDIVKLAGPNGSGKTTLLRLMVSSLSPTSGAIKINGSLRALINFGGGLLDNLNLIDNIKAQFLLYQSRLPTKKEICEIQDFSGLKDDGLLIKEYSSGMKLRLAFSCATAVQADILIMDEWLLVGDADFNAKSSQRLKMMTENASLVIVASHAFDSIPLNFNKSIVL